MTTVSLDLTTLAQDQRVWRSCFLAGLVVILYDHLLTLDNEVMHIWTPKLKRSSAWFLLFRYVAMVNSLSRITLFLGDFDPETCKKLSAAENYLLLIQEFFVGCALCLRVYAMYGFNRKVFLALAIAALTNIGLAAWTVVGTGMTLSSTLPGCHVNTPKSQAIRTAAAWEAKLVGDILILGLTLRRAFTYHRSVGLGSGTLLRVMVRDGAVYFGVICLVNLANIIVLYTGDIITAGSLTWCASAISVTMISRLTLNLHDAANGTSQYDSDHELESMQFRHSVGVQDGVGVVVTLYR
ncbi:hypothetical protein C8R44DRAFT_806750 [Mycena epipterygia]|nr:hypothetical protein C8R44DRAFT_806750 [Mycena epipterygia]